MLVYIPQLTPRVEYIFSTLLNASGISNYNLTNDRLLFTNSSDPKINYSSQRITQYEFWIKPVDLLFEKAIREQTIECFVWEKTKAFFQTSESDFPFDLFAGSFYLISRYEEYLPYRQDIYGRYAHENSIAFREDFLKVPLVNVWLQHFKKSLLERFPFLETSPQNFSFLPTYDIDIAWSYLNKGAVRNAGGLVRSMMEGEWAIAGERINVLFGNQKDPFDNYNLLDELHAKHQLKPLYFFLLASQNKGYDKNILPSNKSLRKLIRRHYLKYSIGIHPSWQTGDQSILLKKEIETLQKITGSDVYKSRQHYIRMSLPSTYRRLIANGITEDYSMGYGSINGFRASYCLPYKWYDLEKEQTTNLTIFPFCYMDANSFYEQHYSSEEALLEMECYFKTVKEVKGLLITIFHNHFLGTGVMFEGWSEMYRIAIERIKG